MRTLRFFGAAVVAAGLVLSGACTDAPSAPEAEEGAGAAQLAIAPRLAVSGGPAATSHTQADALREAFELVDRFRLVVRRLDGEVVADEVVEVSGEPPYDLSLSVPVQQLNEEFDVELTAQDGSVRLFRAGPFRVRSTPEGGPTQTTAVDADLEYVGPGATAASIELEPGVVALSPGGTATLEATVRAEGGNVERGVPLSWSSSDEGRLTVGDDGGVEGVADGAATVTVVSPNGVSATASVYVVAGQVAFVRGGGIHQASAGGGAERLVDGGSLPAWSGDGSTLFYVRGGAVHRMGGGEVTSGSWPSLSPDGTTLAVERGGTVYFVNPDGTNPTPGPSGSEPVWAPGGNALMVSGGGPIERVHASGGSRQTVAGEAGATGPAVAAGGRVAYRGGDGGIFVGTTRISPEGQSSSSRPALSANGRWVVFEAGGVLQVAPADGSGAPVSFGVGPGSHPAWRGHGFTTDPPEVRVEGTSPESPKVGDEVTISGSGFDWIIPANNRVTFPGGGGEGGAGAAGVAEPVPGTVLGVTASSITTVVPEGVEPGQLVVETRWGRASLDFQPTGSTLAIRAETESGGPVAGVGLTATAADGSTSSATTGEDGTATIEDLAGGSYTLEWSAPEGFSVEEAPSSVELPWSETVEVTATLPAEVVDFELVPAEPSVEVGESVELEVRALDVLGNEVTDGVESSWRVLISRVEIEGEGLSRTLTGVHPSREPGDARFEVTVEGIEKRFGATVTSRIAGRVVDDGGTPLEGIEVGLSGDESASAATDAEGRYSFGGLFAGSYTVRATPPAEHEARPPSHEITLWEANPIGTAGFTMVRPEPEGEVQFDLTPGTGAPPSTLGEYTMTPIPYPGAPGCTGTQPPLPTPGGGSVDVAPADQRCIGSGWSTWSHDFGGDVYYTEGSTEQTITLPPGTHAFYLYVEPNPFSLQSFEVVAHPGSVSSGTFTAHGSHGAVYVGVFAPGGGTIESVTITGTTDFASGEYGWAGSSAAAVVQRGHGSSVETVRPGASVDEGTPESETAESVPDSTESASESRCESNTCEGGSSETP